MWCVLATNNKNHNTEHAFQWTAGTRLFHFHRVPVEMESVALFTGPFQRLLMHVSISFNTRVRFADLEPRQLG